MWLTNMFLTVIFLQKNECGNDPLIYALHGRRNRGAHPPRLLMTHEIGSLDLIKYFYFPSGRLSQSRCNSEGFAAKNQDYKLFTRHSAVIDNYNLVICFNVFHHRNIKLCVSAFGVLAGLS